MVKARLDALFVSQAHLTPDRVAIVHQGRNTTYRELDRKASQIGQYLIEQGADPATLVAVCMHRSTDMVAWLLGILKAGAAYVPLDPAYPQERIDYILSDSRADFLIASKSIGTATHFSGQFISLEDWEQKSFAEHFGDLGTRGNADSLAYVIYTSGTTGKPKGVMLSHTASALVKWASETYTERELSRVAATSSICFDPSILEIFVPLCLGGTVILKSNSLEPFSADELPTMIHVVPTVLEQLLKSRMLPDSIQVINLGGERVTATLVRQVQEILPQVKLYNQYGPTEATTTTTVTLIESHPVEDPPIGVPICGARVYVLDETQSMVDVGVTGELYIAGPTLAKGYIHRAELTMEKFVEDVSGHPGERMYRTGDLGCWTEEGNLRFIGRVDDQIKFHGVRIELGEIEASLRAIPLIKNAAVAVRVDPTRKERLVAYVEAKEQVDIRSLREQLGQKLPRQMLPSHFVTVQEWPSTPSGKLDRQALPSPVWASQPIIPAPGGDALEDLIANSFRYAIGVQNVGPDDNFFELGGDSLLAEEVMLELEQILGRSIPATIFVQNPTPRLLAANCFLEPIVSERHLVQLQGKGSRAPLFCTPDVFGMPLSFFSLARALAPEQPVYGLSVGPLETAMITERSLQMLTRAYMKEIKAVQPEGPYQICGYSFGGTAAFDLAQELRAEGQEVALILLDSVIYQRLPKLKGVLVSVVRRGIRKTAGFLHRSRLDWLKVPQLMFARAMPAWVPSRKRSLALALSKAKAKYRYAPFFGETLLVESASPDNSYAVLNRNGMLGWEGLLQGDIVRVQADTSHGGLVRDPYSKQLAAVIHNFLRDVNARSLSRNVGPAHSVEIAGNDQVSVNCHRAALGVS